MATLATPNVDSERRDTQLSPAPASANSSAMDSHVNGISTQQDTIPSLATDPFSNGAPDLSEQSHELMNPHPQSFERKAEGGNKLETEAQPRAFPTEHSSDAQPYPLEPKSDPKSLDAPMTFSAEPSLPSTATADLPAPIDAVPTQPALVSTAPEDLMDASQPAADVAPSSSQPVPELPAPVDVPLETSVHYDPSPSALQPPAETELVPPTDAPAVSPHEPSVPTVPPVEIDQPMSEAPPSPSKSLHERQADDVELPDAPPDAPPDAVHAKLEETSPVLSAPPAASSETQPSSGKNVHERPDDEDDAERDIKRVRTDEVSVSQDPNMQAPVVSEGGAPAPVDGITSTSAAVEDWGPMTDARQRRLIDGMRNIKKSKNSMHFQKPVDPVALNLPSYFEKVKTPMDLSTMEDKLRRGAYQTVSEYVADFDLMVQNSMIFNGSGHPVSQAGTMIRAQLTSQLNRLPKPGEVGSEPQTKQSRRESLPTAPPPKDVKRRTSRPSFGTTAASPGVSHAPGPDGIPLLRRESATGDRPKRRIQKPPPRELTYAKPQKKKYKVELDFCKQVLEELRRGRYASCSAPFLQPVDPVALGIPHYFKVIKKPMDVSTIQQKLDQGQYQNAKEFEEDWRLMFANCFKFNRSEEAVHGLGKEFERIFNEEWAKKSEFVKAHTVGSAERTPEAESEAEEEEEEEEEEDTHEKIRQLHEQMRALQEQTAALMQGSAKTSSKGSSKKNSKSAKGGSAPTKQRKSSGIGVSGSASAPAQKEKKATKSKPKAKPKPVSQKEKEEISTRIGELPPKVIEEVATKITNSLRRIGRHDLADKNAEDMEFQIDDIPDDTLRQLLSIIHKHLGATAIGGNAAEGRRTDTPPTGRGSTSKRKNKPMSADEQKKPNATNSEPAE